MEKYGELIVVGSNHNMAQPVNPFVTSSAPGIDSLSRYLNILKRNGRYIALFVLLSVVATVFVASQLTPVYESTAVVDVDLQAAPGILGQDAQRPITISDSDQVLATQVNLIQSDVVLRPIIETFKITPKEMGFKPEKGIPYEEAPIQLKGLSVKRVPSTYLIRIAYRSEDPKRSAAIANAIANSYVSSFYNIRSQASLKLSSVMERQLQELKDKMAQSSAALAKYERELDVINPEQKTNIVSARLLQLNESYTDAQSDRASKEAAYNAAKVGTLEAAETSPQSGSLRKLVERKDELQAEFAQTSQIYGKNHPQYKSAAAELSQVEREIEAARANITERARMEYQQALSRERILKNAVDENKADFDRLNSRSFEYQQLRRDAEADKQLYQDLIRRIREAGLNSAFQNGSIRVADLARPAVRPVFPKIPLLAFIALVASLISSYLVAFLVQSFRKTVYRADEIATALGLKVISTLPTVRRVRSNKALTGMTNENLPKAASELFKSLFAEPMERQSYEVSSFNESIRVLRNDVVASSAVDGLTVTLVTSGVAGEGKSTVALALAISHALRHKKTLLIDADIRKPGFISSDPLPARVGLADVLRDELPWQEAVQSVPLLHHLDVMSPGSDLESAYDRLHCLTDLFAKVRGHYELIVIDSSPVLAFADAAQIASMVDQVVVIARAPGASLSKLELTLQRLQSIRARIIGLVLNETSDLQLKAEYKRYATLAARKLSAQKVG